VAANRLAMAALHLETGTFNIGGGVIVTVRDVLELLEAIVGHELDVTFGDTQPGDVRHTSADTYRAREMLGFAPKVALADGLAREVEWMRSIL